MELHCLVYLLPLRLSHVDMKWDHFVSLLTSVTSDRLLAVFQHMLLTVGICNFFFLSMFSLGTICTL